ncbi:histidine permease [Aureobasidium pullulans]|uniref:Histidine permease n=1 Tax=Aureobasidium pullulans TaxID=5580 RepID=A0A4S9KAA4_AURPU|nr:histidine permease [Aureobasidium pullulans]THY12108.1 histidine permease [Aureobasidium pullulans]
MTVEETRHAYGEDKKYPTDLQQIDTEHEGEIYSTGERVGTKRNIKSRHAQMIAIGGSIGTGLFLGAGQALHVGGPGILLAAYSLMSLLVYGIVTAVIEVSTYLPVSGASISYYCGRFISPSLGFALGWLYFYSFGIIVAYELTAASIVINYWPNAVPIAVWITIMMILIIGLNLCPVGIYAETEFWFAGTKVVMILGLLLLSLIIMLGGGPDHDRLGFRYWNNPGAVNEYLVDGSAGQFTAFLYTWVYSGFSFYFGAELMVFTSGEMHHPRKNLPTASRRFFVRLVVFYVFSTIAIGVTCQSNAKGLTTGAGNANASPFVIAIKNASIPILPSIINAGILVSAWSAGNSYLYMSSRALYSLAVAGSAPKIFTRCNRWGLPIYAVLAASCFAPLAYLNCSTQASVVFNWFISLTNTAGYLSWIMCCVLYLRFRKGTDAQGIKPPFRSRLQPYASYVCMFAFTVLLLCNGFTLFYPGQFSVSGFITTYIGIVVFLALYLGHKVVAGRNQAWMYSTTEMDLTTGLREVNADAARWDRDDEELAESQKHKNVVLRKLSLLWE